MQSGNAIQSFEQPPLSPPKGEETHEIVHEIKL
jgi:hypothetical protein